MNTNVNPIADQNTIFSEVAKRMVNTALSDLTNEELIVYAFTVLPEPVHRDVLMKFTLQNRCAMTAEVYERAFAKAFELGYFVKTFSNTVKMEPVLAKAIEEAEEAKGKPVQAISTNEEMAKFIAENPAHRYSNQQLVICLLYSLANKVDRATLFEVVNRNRASIDGIAFDAIIDGLQEEEIVIVSERNLILTHWFNDHMVKYMKPKANAEVKSNPIHLEQIAKNVVYQPEENLSDLELIAKLSFICNAADEDIISEHFFARRKLCQETIPYLIKTLQELGVVNNTDPVLFPTKEFNERLSFHKEKFHEGLKGPTASQVDEGSSADNTKHMREGLGMCRLLEKLMPMVAARNKGMSFVDPKWTTQEYVNALVFGVLGDSYLDKVCIFNNVSLLMKENRPSHDVLVEWVANALTYFVSYNIADFNTAKEYRLTDDAIKCIKEAEERLKPKVAPFEASYKVYGKTFDGDTLLRLIDFLIAFSKVAEDDKDTVSIQGIDFNKTKALEFIGHLDTRHQMFDEFLKTRGVEPTFKSTLVHQSRIKTHVHRSSGTDKDIPNGH